MDSARAIKHGKENGVIKPHEPADYRSNVMRAAPALLIAITATAVYANTLRHGFVFDDMEGILNNPLINRFSDLSQISQFFRERWRSLPQLSYALTYYFFGFDARAFHAVNIAIHAINSILVFGIARLAARRWLPLAQKDAFALAAALIHAVHPIYSEAVAYIWGRSSSLCALFYFSSLLLVMKGALEPGRRKYLWFGCAIVCGTLAWKTKEEAITLAMAIAGLFVLQGSRRAAAGTALIPFFLVMSRWTDIGRLYVRVGENKPLVAAGSQPSLSPGVYFLTHVKASVSSYLRLFIWPQNLNVDPLVEPVTHVYDPLFLFCIIVLLSLVLGGLLAARNHGIVSFGILTLLVSPLTAYALMPLADVVAEHRVYISGLGFDLLMAWATTLCFRYAKMATALAILILGSITIRRNEVWNNNVTLWQDAERKSPTLARPHLNLGLAYQSAGQLDAALTEYHHAISINSRLAPAYINMGVIYLSRKDLASAEAMLKRAVELAPTIAASYINLAIVAMGQDRLEGALLLLDKAASIEDTYIIHLNKGDILARMNRYEEAAGEYHRAAALRPDLRKQADERLKRLSDRRPSP